jgi:hypothetical protein
MDFSCFHGKNHSPAGTVIVIVFCEYLSRDTGFHAKSFLIRLSL